MLLYQSPQGLADAALPMRELAQAMHEGVRLGWRNAPVYPVSKLAAMYELIGLARLSHERPEFGIEGVTEEIALARPFGSLLHFRKPVPHPGPRVLVVAPLSGHFATLLRATVRTLLADHDVYITDWHNPREIGPFEQAEINLSNAPKRVSYEPASSGSSKAGAWEQDHNFITPPQQALL